jgi:hypothetical protein
MQIDNRIRRNLRNRAKIIKRTGLFKRTVLIFVLLIVFCCLDLPGTFSFFTSSNTLRSTLNVTSEYEYITASLVFEDQQDQISESNRPGSINAVLKFGRAYDVKNVDVYSLKAYSGIHSLGIDNVSPAEEGLLLSFYYESVKSLLGHGSHTVCVEGMFTDGWIKFSAEGTLVIIDRDVVAEQEAIKLVEGLEADSTAWYRVKIDAVIKAVNNLREGAVRDDLLRRLQNIEERFARIIKEMNERKLFEEAENALSIAEETRTKENCEKARELIAKLPEDERKKAMEKRLEFIETIGDKNSGNPSVIDDVYKSAGGAADMQDEIGKLLQESEQELFMFEKNSEKVSD